MKQDAINVIQSALSRESNKRITLSNDGEHIETYRVYVNGHKTRLFIDWDELIYFGPSDISLVLETLKTYGDL